LSNADLEKLRGVAMGELRSITLSMLFNVSDGVDGLGKAVDELCASASKAIAEGASILILSDRGVDRDQAPIPALLATAAVHHHLIRQGQRPPCGVVSGIGEGLEAHSSWL